MVQGYPAQGRGGGSLRPSFSTRDGEVKSDSSAAEGRSASQGTHIGGLAYEQRAAFASGKSKLLGPEAVW